MLAELGTLSLSYGAGALSTLSPCVLPILPIVLFGALQQHAWGPAALAAGLSISFAAIGLFVSLVGFGIGLDQSVLRPAIAVLMIAMGVVLFVPVLQYRLASAAAPVADSGQRWLSKFNTAGIRGQFILGVLLGAIWSPCTGPTLGAAVGLAARTDTALQAGATMTVFGLGASTPILLLAYGSRQAMAARRDRLAASARIVKPIMAAVLVLVGASVLTGFDKLIETTLTSAMPDWLVTVTTRL